MNKCYDCSNKIMCHASHGSCKNKYNILELLKREKKGNVKILRADRGSFFII